MVPESLAHFFGIGLTQIELASGLLVVVLAWLAWMWWTIGRDRWYGDVSYLTGNTTQRIKPPFARETVVVEYTPPGIGEKKRPIRPAEMGLLINERANTLDTTATIIDLVARGYLRIRQPSWQKEAKEKGYELVMVRGPDEHMLGYERTLMYGLFGQSKSILFNELPYHAEVRLAHEALYDQVVERDHFFSGTPPQVRRSYQVYACALLLTGLSAILILGALADFGLLGVPLVLAALAMLPVASVMPRRTALGREFYRRCLGFRQFMVSQKERQGFLEEEGVFEKYLPYAIVLGCAGRWAETFADIGVYTGKIEHYVGEIGVLRALTSSLAPFVDYPMTPEPAVGCSRGNGS